MSNAQRPVGIIDSGIGGFSVARSVQRLLPGEHLLYFGDGANTPYGNHSEEEILTLTRYMLRFMEEQKVKALLVACNTISCLIDRYRDEMSCPVFSVVEAGAQAAATAPFEKLGVISTVFTHTTGCYPDSIRAAAPRKQVVSRGCPNLAMLIERNLGDPGALGVIEDDLKQELKPLVEEAGIECCVLGCTHYPLVEDSIGKLFPQLPLIDPAQKMAEAVKAYLEGENLLAREQGRLDIFTTGDAALYREKAEKIGLNPITSVQTYPAGRLAGV